MPLNSCDVIFLIQVFMSFLHRIHTIESQLSICEIYVYGNSAIFVYFYSNKDTALFVFRQMMAKFVNFEITGRVIRLLYLNFDARNSFSISI